MAKTKALLEGELEECKAQGRQVVAELASLKDALNREKVKNHNLQGEVCDRDFQVRQIQEQLDNARIEVDILRAGAIKVIGDLK